MQTYLLMSYQMQAENKTLDFQKLGFFLVCFCFWRQDILLCRNKANRVVSQI